MWRLMITFWKLDYSFPKFVKLIELAMVQIIGSVEDGRCFSMLAILISKLHNMFITHLPLVVHMFA
jgi:hypothetical protein